MLQLTQVQHSSQIPNFGTWHNAYGCQEKSDVYILMECPSADEKGREMK